MELLCVGGVRSNTKRQHRHNSLNIVTPNLEFIVCGTQYELDISSELGILKRIYSTIIFGITVFGMINKSTSRLFLVFVEKST